MHETPPNLKWSLGVLHRIGLNLERIIHDSYVEGKMWMELSTFVEILEGLTNPSIHEFFFFK